MASALGSILNNPQAMQQIMGLASQLGLGGPAAEPAPAPPPVPAAPPSAPAQPPSAPAAPLFTPPPAQPAPAPQPGLGGLLGNLDVGTIAKLSQIMGTMNTRDENVDLLMALKPHFGEKRRKKVDDAIRVMQLVKVLPLLKEAGIFGSLFGGGDS